MRRIVSEVKHWKESIPKFSHILFDNDAIVTLLAHESKSLFKEFQELDITPCYIHPVLMEALAIKKSTERLARSNLLEENDFQLLPLTKKEYEQGRVIQSYLYTREIFPSPTDLYLAATLAASKSNEFYLLTGNISDFPEPLFTKHAYLINLGDKNGKLLYFLSIDKRELRE